MTALEINRFSKRARNTRRTHRQALANNQTNNRGRCFSATDRIDPLAYKPLARAFRDSGIQTLDTAQVEKEMAEYKEAYCRTEATRRSALTGSLLRNSIYRGTVIVLFILMFMGFSTYILLAPNPAVTMVQGVTFCALASVVACYIMHRMVVIGQNSKISATYGHLMTMTYWESTPIDSYWKSIPFEARRNAETIEKAPNDKALIEVMSFYKDPYLRARLGDEVIYFAHW